MGTRGRFVAAVWLSTSLVAPTTRAAVAQNIRLEPAPERSARAPTPLTRSVYSIRSRILGQTRHIGIELPSSHAAAPNRRYPVTVVLDGEAYLGTTSIVSAELVRHGLIPEAIIVAIENEDPLRGRVHDLTPPGLSVSGSGVDGGGDRFLDFVEQELLPAVERQFRGGAPRALIGHSSGGVLAIYAAATRPGFRAVVAIDAPVHLGQNWLPKRLIERAKRDSTPLRFAYMKARFQWPQSEWAELTANAPASWRLYAEDLRREGHETAFMPGAYIGLREVYAEYSRMAAPDFPTTGILPYYDRLSRIFGTRLTPPRRILSDVTENLLMEGRGKEAGIIFDSLVAAYGAPQNAADMRQRIAQVSAQPPPTETVESFLEATPPTVREGQAFVGEWRGDVWRSANAPRPGNQTLRIRAVDDRIVVELENPNAPPEFRSRSFRYVRFVGDSIVFGNLNGMRPRGFMLQAGVMRGDTIAGVIRWGGIRFTPPGGLIEDEGFRFVRVPR